MSAGSASGDAEEWVAVRTAAAHGPVTRPPAGESGAPAGKIRHERLTVLQQKIDWQFGLGVFETVRSELMCGDNGKTWSVFGPPPGPTGYRQLPLSTAGYRPAVVTQLLVSEQLRP